MTTLQTIFYSLGCVISIIFGFSVFFIASLRVHNQLYTFFDHHRKSGLKALMITLKSEKTLLEAERKELQRELAIIKASKKEARAAMERMVEEA